MVSGPVFSKGVACEGLARARCYGPLAPLIHTDRVDLSCRLLFYCVALMITNSLMYYADNVTMEVVCKVKQGKYTLLITQSCIFTKLFPYFAYTDALEMLTGLL